jgi:hypothetical protein
MSAIIRDVINQACQLANLIDQTEQASGTDSQIAVTQLNLLLTSLNVEQLFPYSCKIVSYPLVASLPSYTIGITTIPSMIVSERPSFIERIMYFSGANAQPLDLFQLALPDLLAHTRTGSGTPRNFALNPSYPAAEIFFDLAPSVGSGASLKLIYNAAIPPVNINSVLEVPPEYNEVLICGLARKLCVTHSMPAELLQSVDILYKQAIERIFVGNSRNQVSTLDLYGSPNGGASNNIMAFNAYAIGGY